LDDFQCLPDGHSSSGFDLPFSLVNASKRIKNRLIMRTLQDEGPRGRKDIIETEVFMMIRNILILVMGLGLLACSRESGETSNLQVSLPFQMKNSALGAALEFSHVIINVTGKDLNQPLLFTWSRCHDCPDGGKPIPEVLTLDNIPAGSDRLIQIMAVLYDSTTKEMIFYYGDVLKALSLPEENVSIDAQKIGTGSQVISGRVSGRYLTGIDSGPTGPVDIKYDPGVVGRPALIIDEAAIVNGWFSFFMLSGIEFTYVHRSTGAVLWGQKVSLDSAVFDPDSEAGVRFYQRVKAFVPAHTVAQGAGGTNYSNREPSIFAWGYWGLGAATKKVCTQSFGAETSQIKIHDVPANYPIAEYLNISRLVTVGDPVPTNAELLDTASPYDSVVIKGGANMTGMCGAYMDDADNQYLNFLKIKQAQVDGGGNDGAAGFSGIFRLNASGDALALSSDPKVLTGQLLPGVYDIFSQLKLFKRAGTEEFHMETPNCRDIESGTVQGFQAGTLAGSISSDGSFALTSDITSSEVSSGVSAVLCPVTGGGILSRFGIFFSKWDLGYSPP